MDNLVALSSMTEALRAKSILEKYRIPSRVQRIPGSVTGKGCTFGLIIPQYRERAIEVLARYNIYPKGRASGDML